MAKNKPAPTPTPAKLPPAVEARLTDLYKMAASSYLDPAITDEHSFVWNKFGNPGNIGSTHESDHDHLVITPGYTSGLIHTHPVSVDFRPSDGDVDTAKKAGINNYVLSQRQLWVASPDGTRSKVADVSFRDGKLSLSYVGQPETAPAAQPNAPTTQPPAAQANLGALAGPTTD